MMRGATMRVAIRVLLTVLLCWIVSVPTVGAEDETEKKPNPHRGGALRLGAFWVFQIDTAVAVKSQKYPLGLHIDISKDLGLDDSATVPRALFTYRFNRRSQLDFDWFSIKREGGKRLERTIDFGPREFEIGVGVEAFTDISIYKAVYTWLFHDDPKVRLGLSAGVHVVDFEFGVDAGPDRIADDDFSERAGITAPLPVIGGRLFYQVNPRLGVLFTADVLMVNFDKYSGTFQDVYAVAEYRLSKRFGIGAGLNVLGLDLDIDGDDQFANINNTLTGVMFYGAIYF
jgi:hypothetical protein